MAAGLLLTAAWPGSTAAPGVTVPDPAALDAVLDRFVNDGI